MITLNLGEQEAQKIYKKLILKQNPLWIGLRNKLAKELKIGFCKECGQELPKKNKKK